MATRFEQYKAEYERNLDALRIRPGVMPQVDRVARTVLAGKPRYQDIERRTGVPWWFVGLCHYRESACNFNTYLGNGQPLSRVTTIVPKGRGPFTGPKAFENGAVDALQLQGLHRVSDWSSARTVYRLEAYNGFGYHYHGVNSPYLYGGSNLYGPPEARAGKYVRDGVFDKNHVDKQLGTLVVLWRMMELDSSIKFGGGVVPGGNEVEEELERGILWVQRSLNILGAKPRLVEDGINGPATKAAVLAFQAAHGLDEDGIAGSATIAKIEGQLAPTVSTAPEEGWSLADAARSVLRSIFG